MIVDGKILVQGVDKDYFQDKFEILPIDQKVNFCNFSAEVK